MKKLMILTLVCLMVVSLFTGCNGKKDHTEDSRRFKEEYESLNGKQNTSGRDYRIIEIDFYKFDFSEVPVLIGAFALGPIEVACIELVKILLNFVMNGTSTGGIGEIANFPSA